MPLADLLRSLFQPAPVTVDYSRCSRQDLVQLLKERDQLTPEAVQALEAECQRRGIPVPEPASAAPQGRAKPTARSTVPVSVVPMAEEERALNRDGTLAPSQDWARPTPGNVLFPLGMTVLFGGIAAAFLPRMAETGDLFDGRDGPLGGLILLVVLLGLPLAFAGYTVVMARDLIRSTRGVAVVSQVGPVRRRSLLARGGRRYLVDVGQGSFTVPRDVHDALVEGQTWRFYYTDPGRVLLWAEPA